MSKPKAIESNQPDVDVTDREAMAQLARRAMCGDIDALRSQLTQQAAQLAAVERERERLRSLASKQSDEIQNLSDMADAVECLRDIGKQTGCDHVDGPDGRRQLVNCVEQVIAALESQLTAAQASRDESLARYSLLYTALGCDASWTPEAIQRHAKELYQRPVYVMCSNCETMHNPRQDCRVCAANNERRAAERQIDSLNAELASRDELAKRCEVLEGKWIDGPLPDGAMRLCVLDGGWHMILNRTGDKCAAIGGAWNWKPPMVRSHWSVEIPALTPASQPDALAGEGK